jgi:hypothetical protein
MNFNKSCSISLLAFLLAFPVQNLLCLQLCILNIFLINFNFFLKKVSSVCTVAKFLVFDLEIKVG